MPRSPRKLCHSSNNFAKIDREGVGNVKRVVICGLSHRAFNMFIKPLIEDFHEHYMITGLLDIDTRRYTLCQERFPSLRGVAFFQEDEFDQMVKETKPDIVIVAGRDDTHVTYILQALDHDLDVITEKPMVTTARP